MDELLLEVDVARGRAPTASRAAQAGRVDELDQRAVAERERPVAARRASSAPSTSAALRRVRQPPRPARRERAPRARAPRRARSAGTSGPPRACARSSPARACRPVARAELGRVVRRARARRRRSSAVFRRSSHAANSLEVDAVRAAGRLARGPARRGSARSRRPRHASRSRAALRSPARGRPTRSASASPSWPSLRRERAAGPGRRRQRRDGQDELARAIAAPRTGAARGSSTSGTSTRTSSARGSSTPTTTTLDFVPPWYGSARSAARRARGAHISLAGVDASRTLRRPRPGALGRDLLPRVKETSASSTTGRRTGRRAGPDQGWAALGVSGRSDDAACTALGGDLARARLDEPTIPSPRGASASR